MKKYIEPLLGQSIQELLRLVNPRQYLDPAHHGQNIIRITCKNEFEGHGRASETWEEHWYLELYQEQYYWKTNKGILRKGKEGLTQQFHGKTLADVIRDAVNWYYTPKEEL